MAPSSSSKGSRRSLKPMAEINVTPMVDVMLVLLVVFMISAPLMNNSVKVDLPSHTAAPLEEDQNSLVVTLTLEHEVYLGEKKMSFLTIADALKVESQGDLKKRVYVRADQGLSYGDVMQGMSVIRDAGFSKIALVSDFEGAGTKT